jgi:predicted dienelactone hydrolase
MGEGDLQAFKDRVDDIHFVIDQIEQLNAGKLDGTDYAAFKGKLDLDRIGMSGHSFGAITTQAIVGQVYVVLGKSVSFADPRIKAGIAMSGSGARGESQDAAFGAIKIPVFYLTGTEDKMGNIASGERRMAFDHSGGSATYLLTFNGGTHMTFVPAGRLGESDTKEQFQKYVRESTTAFWDAYLKGDAAAKKWIDNDFKTELGKTGVFETKPAPK